MLWEIYDNNKYIHINEYCQIYSDNSKNNYNKKLTLHKKWSFPWRISSFFGQCNKEFWRWNSFLVTRFVRGQFGENVFQIYLYILYIFEMIFGSFLIRSAKLPCTL